MTTKRLVPGVNDLATLRPDIAADWDYEKNGGLKPSDVTALSGRKVWWKCRRNHSWAARIQDRSTNCGCPFCGGRRVLAGFNDLATLRPDIAAQWDYEKNGALQPSQVTLCSGIHVWWKCEHGHSWRAAIGVRTSGCNCPFCSGRNAVSGFNDLATLYPDIAAQWDHEKNGELKPECFMPFSGRKVWWKCGLNHSWPARIRSRTRGNGCPFCAGNRALPGFNDLATLRPDIAAQWDYEKNGDLTPEDVTVAANKKVWWKCERDHSWQAVIASRSAGCNCPFCFGAKVLPGFNDLATLYPDIAAQWDYEKNGELRPEQVTAHSTRKIWWKCSVNHSWCAEISNRSTGNGCPFCAGTKVWPGFNDLASVSPWLLEFWDYERNVGLSPSELMPHTNRSAWWKCQYGHHWRDSVVRMQTGKGCPYCYRGGTARYRGHIVPSI